MAFDIPFEVADHGRNFAVLCFDDVVVKVPKRSKIQRQLDEIAAVQNELAAEVDGVLPCEVVEDVLVMPKAPGVRGDAVPDDEWPTVERAWDHLREEARTAGYEIKGSARENVFWDGEQAYAIDLSHTSVVED